MQLIAVKDVFEEGRAFLEGKRDGQPHEKNLNKAEALFNEILNNNLGHPGILYCLGTVQLERGHFALAIQLLSQVTQIDPKFGEAWNNMCLAYRGINDFERAVICARKAAKLISNADMPCNIAAMHLSRNMPEAALEWAEEALKRDPGHIKAQWHKALALLEMRRWNEAWDWHESRLGGGGNESIAIRNYHGPDGMTPSWDGQKREAKTTVVIHGEQGMGDEIMFASCIPDALQTGAKIILEPSPRMEKLFKRSFPFAFVHGTDEVDGRSWIAIHGKPDFKCPVASLPKFYRRAPGSFPGTPYLRPDPALRGWWSDKLKALHPSGPRIGLAWQGGVQQTRIEARSFHPTQFHPLLRGFPDVAWVSLQYDKTAQANVEEVREKLGVKIAHWPKAVEARDPETQKPNDLDELVALVSKLDLVISVCQTAIHVAGALGVPCWCLTPSQPSWRYGAGESTTMPWYKSVELIRQPKGVLDWSPTMDAVAERLGRFLAQRKIA